MVGVIEFRHFLTFKSHTLAQHCCKIVFIALIIALFIALIIA